MRTLFISYSVARCKPIIRKGRVKVSDGPFLGWLTYVTLDAAARQFGLYNDQMQFTSGGSLFNKDLLDYSLIYTTLRLSAVESKLISLSTIESAL